MRIIYGRDMAGATAFHAIETTEDEYPWFYLERGNSGISRGTRETLISAIANYMGHAEKTDRLYSIECGPQRLMLDELGNTWIDHEYLAPDRWLQKLIEAS